GRAWLGPAREIEEIIVWAITVEIVRSFSFVGSEQEHHATVGFTDKFLAASSKIGIRLAVKCKRELANEKKKQQGLSYHESLRRCARLLCAAGYGFTCSNKGIHVGFVHQR